MDLNYPEYRFEKLIERHCTFCSNPDSIVIIFLKYEDIFPLNHTFKPAWFSETSLSASSAFPIVRCTGCQFVYSKFTLNKELQYAFYNEAVDADASKEKIFKKAKRIHLLAIWNRLHSLADIGDQRVKVLDFGAGWGDFLAIAKCIHVEVYGLEFDVRKIEFARQNGIPSGDFEFINLHTPFDIFMCNQVLEHLEDPRASLRQLRSMLRSGAVGYIAVPDFSSERLNQEIQTIQRGGAPTMFIPEYLTPLFRSI